jgi:hypothetical protein
MESPQQAEISSGKAGFGDQAMEEMLKVTRPRQVARNIEEGLQNRIEECENLEQITNIGLYFTSDSILVSAFRSLVC